MSCARDEEQFLVLRAGGVAETLLSKVECVGIAARHHQQWLVDEVHPVVSIKSEEVNQATLGVAESGVGVAPSYTSPHGLALWLRKARISVSVNAVCADRKLEIAIVVSNSVLAIRCRIWCCV